MPGGNPGRATACGGRSRRIPRTPCTPVPPRSNAQAAGRTRRSIEDRSPGAGALDLEEAVDAGHPADAVPELARLLALGRGRDDRAEEGDALHRDHRGADLLADPVDAVVVRGAQSLVELLGVHRVGERPVEPRGLQRLLDGLAEPVELLEPALVVEAGAELGVEPADRLGVVLP